MSVKIPATNARVRIVWVAAVLLALLLLLAGTATVPLVAMEPGPTFDVLGQSGGKPVITVADRPTYPTTGHLNMTTVSIEDHLTALQAFGLWLSPGARVIPRSVIYPVGLTDAQVSEANNQMFSTSESDAVLAALRSLGEPIEVRVAQMTPGSPAGSVLRVNDQITAVNGSPIISAKQVTAIMGRSRPGDEIHIVYRRDGGAPTDGVVKAGLRPADISDPEDGPRGFLGIVAQTRSAQPEHITVGLNDVGGPSAGLMFTLGVLDKIAPGDLAGGKFIAGTGTIDDLGQVGEIEGIPFKMMGARGQGAQVFLVPTANCTEAKDTAPAGLQLIKVNTLTDAVNSLRALKAGQPVPGC